MIYTISITKEGPYYLGRVDEVPNISVVHTDEEKVRELLLIELAKIK